MANKKISELAVRTPSLTDLMLVGDPSTGYSYKATLSALSTLLEANIALDDLNDVTITSPTAGQVLSYNGTAWVNDTNGITGTGTTNYVTKFTSSSAIGNSQIFDNGTNVGIGTATPDSTSRVEISKTDGYGLYINYTTNSGVAPTATGLYVINNTNLYGYSAVIEEKTPNTNTGQIPLLIKSSLSSGTAAVGFSTGIHFESPDDAGTFKRGQLSVDITNAAAATFSNRFRFNVRYNDVSTNVFYVAGNGIGVFRGAPTAALDVNGDVKIETIANATTDTDKFIVSDGGVIKYRTGSEVLSDIGGAAASSISGTTNYIPKFTSSSAIGNSNIYQDNAGNIGINTTSPQSGIGAQWVDLRSSIIAGFQATAQNTGTVLRMYAFEGGAGSPSHGSYIGNQSNHWLGFITNNNEKMRLDASGNLGLGTSSPAYKLDVNGDLRVSTIANATTDTDRFIVSDGGVIKYRTGSEVLSDIGGAAASSISGTTNYIPKFTSSSAIGNSVIQDDGSTVTITSLTNNIGEFRIYPSSGTAILRFGSGSTEKGKLSVDISTNMIFETGGSERMRLDASGNLGLGTSSPSYKLDVNGTGRFIGTSTEVLTLHKTSGDGSQLIMSTTLGGGNTYGISPYIAGVSNGGFSITDITNNAQRFVIAGSTGNVGIGTTSPSTDLHISKAGSTTLRVTNTNNSTNVELGIATALGFVGTKSDNSFAFNTNDTERMRITNGGNVGIGTTTPQSIFDITAATPIMTISASTNTVLHGIEWKAGTNLDAFIKQLPVIGEFRISNGRSAGWGGFITFYTDISERMRITSGGELLINTTSDRGAYILQAQGSATIFNTAGNNAYLEMAGNGNTSGGSSVLYGQDGASGGYFWNRADAPLYFATNSTERMRITSGGELLINTTSDAGDYKLQVNGNSYLNGFTNFIGYAEINADATTWGLQIKNSNAGGYGLFIRNGDDTKPSLRINNAADTQNSVQIFGDGKIETTGSIKTAAPSGGTAKPFKIGAAATVTPTSQNRTIEIEIDGTTYYLTAKTTND